MSISVTMHDAKTNLSHYAALVERGIQDKVVLKRGNTPIAQIEPYTDAAPRFVIGVAEGRYSVGDIDAHNDEIASMFYGE